MVHVQVLAAAAVPSYSLYIYIYICMYIERERCVFMRFPYVVCMLLLYCAGACCDRRTFWVALLV